MTKNTKEVQGYFTSNPKHDTLWFTKDGMPFKTEHDANNQADALVKKFGAGYGGVTAVTKDEAFAEGATASEGSSTKQAMIDYEVTQEDLDKNPDLVTQGVVVGDVIQIPADATQTTPEEIAADVAVAAKKPVKKSAKKK
jgi:hypothetical protein